MTNIREWVNSITDKKLLESLAANNFFGECTNCPLGIERCKENGLTCKESLKNWALGENE